MFFGRIATLFYSVVTHAGAVLIREKPCDLNKSRVTEKENF